jgi:hypothetical protein
MSQAIPLNRGQFALVDDDDYERLTAYEWFLSGTGYAVGFVPTHDKFALIYMHRLILNAGPEQHVDHINGDLLDNCRQNLRLATPQQNTQNRGLSTLSLTGLKGVSWHKRRQKFHARIQLQGVRCHLGFFDDAETAALAYDYAARTLFGVFSHCNYPEEKTPRCVALVVAQRLKRRGLLKS